MLKKTKKLPVLGIFETRTDQNASAGLYKLSSYLQWLHDLKDHLDHGVSKVLMNPCPEIGFCMFL